MIVRCVVRVLRQEDALADTAARASIALFASFGFKHIQNTYELTT